MVREGIGDAVQARWLELAKDSGPVDCTYDQAVQVVTREAHSGSDTATAAQTRPGRAGRWTGSRPGGPGTGSARGRVGAAELRFGVSVSAKGELADEAREKVSEILAEVAEDLKLGG